MPDDLDGYVPITTGTEVVDFAALSAAVDIDADGYTRVGTVIAGDDADFTALTAAAAAASFTNPVTTQGVSAT